MNKEVIIIQARMGSNRFPGKSLTPIGGMPLLGHTIEALKSGFDRANLVIATSEEPDSDPLAIFAQKASVEVFRGDEINVASRFLKILKGKKPDYFCRISGDSPFVDCETVKAAFETAKNLNVDLVSTTGSKFPSGFNVEVMRSEVFAKTYRKFSSSDHFEHVTKYFYENSQQFRIQYLPCPIKNSSSFKFTVDTVEDRDRMELFFSNLKKPPYKYSLQEKCDIYKSLFEVLPC
jgi:spore coat polysaccharide biosynthesis protein SpsF (cytidylyltransferase family)